MFQVTLMDDLDHELSCRTIDSLAPLDWFGFKLREWNGINSSYLATYLRAMMPSFEDKVYDLGGDRQQLVFIGPALEILGCLVEDCAAHPNATVRVFDD